MANPKTKEQWIDAGYVYDNDSFCRACGVPIEWWITPTGHKMPMTVREEKRDAGRGFFDPPQQLIRVPHWADCEFASDFRKKKLKEGKV
jgi:hypothetical protein